MEKFGFKTLRQLKEFRQEGPAASVLIRVKNEVAALPRLLESLRSQSVFERLEVIFLDSGSTDGTLELITKFKCSVYAIDGSEFAFGRTCNLLCELASSPLFVFLSGHIAFSDPDLLKTAIERTSSHECVGALFRQVPNQMLGCSSYERAYLQYKFGRNEFRVLSAGDVPFSNAASLVTRVAWQKAKFADVIASEDMLWALEQAKEGGLIGYLGDLEVEHSHNESPAQVRKRVHINARAQYGDRPVLKKALVSFAGVFVHTYKASTSIRESLSFAFAHASAYFGTGFNKWIQRS